MNIKSFKLKQLIALTLIMSCVIAQSAVSVVFADAPAIKNVIYMIPDGGGYDLFDFAAAVKANGGFDKKRFPNATPVEKGEAMYLSDYLRGSERTYSASDAITDSAASGTALSSGYKTTNAFIGVTPDHIPRATILEACQMLGKKAGIISTYEWTHATPAAFTAHSSNRYDGYPEMSEQIVNQSLEVVLGSGFGLAKWGSIKEAEDRGYNIINDKTELAAVKQGDRIWGNMTGNSSMPFDIEINDKQPTLAEMTKAAITALTNDDEGFFLMVEGSKVDAGGHSNNLIQTSSEYIAFDRAFEVAVEFAKTRKDTIVIAMPDHDTGGLNLSENYSTAVNAVSKAINSTNGISWTTTGHTARNCPVWMYLPEGVNPPEGLSKVPGDSPETRARVINNTDITPFVASLIGVDLDHTTKVLFQNVTPMGVYDSENATFTFKDYDVVVKPNQSSAIVNGEAVDLDGQVCVRINEKFFVPFTLLDKIVPVPDYGVFEAAAEISVESGSAEASVIITSPYKLPEMRFSAFFAYYDKDGKLTDARVNKYVKTPASGENLVLEDKNLPSDIGLIRCIVWSEISETVPACSASLDI